MSAKWKLFIVDVIVEVIVLVDHYVQEANRQLDNKVFY